MNSEVYHNPMYVMYEVGSDSFAVRDDDGRLNTFPTSDYTVRITVTPKEISSPAAGWYIYADDHSTIEYYSAEEFRTFPRYADRVKRGELYRVEVTGIRTGDSDDG